MSQRWLCCRCFLFCCRCHHWRCRYNSRLDGPRTLLNGGLRRSNNNIRNGGSWGNDHRCSCDNLYSPDLSICYSSDGDELFRWEGRHSSKQAMRLPMSNCKWPEIQVLLNEPKSGNYIPTRSNLAIRSGNENLKVRIELLKAVALHLRYCFHPRYEGRGIAGLW